MILRIDWVIDVIWKYIEFFFELLNVVYLINNFYYVCVWSKLVWSLIENINKDLLSFELLCIWL